MIKLISSLSILALAAAGAAQATEGGGSNYPVGAEAAPLSGAVPPPGLYTLLYYQHYRSTTLRDGTGQVIPVPGFRVAADAVVPRFVWSTPTAVAGGNLVWQLIVPLVKLDVQAAGASDSRTGLGDVTVGSAIAWHHSASLHSVAGVNLVLPTGSYSATRLANIGRNYATVQPAWAMSRVVPEGWLGNVKVTLNFNRRNGDTDYRSGDEWFIEGNAGWAFNAQWSAGIAGYATGQISDDKLAGQTVANSRSKVRALGPQLKYDSGAGWFVSLQYQNESGAANRTEGSAWWVKAVLPF